MSKNRTKKRKNFNKTPHTKKLIFASGVKKKKENYVTCINRLFKN